MQQWYHELQSQQVHLEMSPNEQAPSFKTIRQPHAAVADQSVWQVGQPVKHNSWPLSNVRNMGLPGHSPWIPSFGNQDTVSACATFCTDLLQIVQLVVKKKAWHP